MARGISVWHVQYNYSYRYYDEEESKWFTEKDTGCCCFECLKSDIKKNVEFDIRESLEGVDYENLKIDIIDQYIDDSDELQD